MKQTIRFIIIALSLFAISDLHAQEKGKGKGSKGKGGKGPANKNIGEANPLSIGEAGIAWYTTWESGLKEAKRSNRPIMFMSAATTCSGVPGVF